jgi:hypothetical protein
MPNHVMNELIFRDVNVAKQNEIIAKLCNAEGKVDFNILVPIPLNIWMGNVGLSHERAFGKGTGLDWCREHWSTKWNAYSHMETKRTDATLTLRFETAWSQPYRWLVAVFNSLRCSFDHNWLDEGRERGVSGKWDFTAIKDGEYRNPWTEEPCSDEMQKYLHKLHYGVEVFEDEEDAE